MKNLIISLLAGALSPLVVFGLWGLLVIGTDFKRARDERRGWKKKVYGRYR